MKTSIHRKQLYLILLAFMLFLILFGYGGYRYITLSRAFTTSKDEYLSQTQSLEQIISELKEIITEYEDEQEDLLGELDEEKNKNSTFERQIREIAGTVGDLDKLAKTDEELLQKYSKIYFLNEHYTPSHLTEIPSKYTYNKEKEYEIHSEVWPYLEDLLEEAVEDGIDLSIISAYRSFGTQAVLKSSYSVTYGSGANTFSADQGYSEHQLGTTVDFTTMSVGSTFEGFEKTDAYAWLLKNAHRYGFILSYPPHNAYYQYEPWHWRFVGKDLARKLNRDEKYFYDMDQREINTYLIEIFD